MSSSCPNYFFSVSVFITPSPDCLSVHLSSLNINGSLEKGAFPSKSGTFSCNTKWVAIFSPQSMLAELKTAQWRDKARALSFIFNVMRCLMGVLSNLGSGKLPRETLMMEHWHCVWERAASGHFVQMGFSPLKPSGTCTRRRKRWI